MEREENNYLPPILAGTASLVNITKKSSSTFQRDIRVVVVFLVTVILLLFMFGFQAYVSIPIHSPVSAVRETLKKIHAWGEGREKIHAWGGGREKKYMHKIFHCGDIFLN